MSPRRRWTRVVAVSLVALCASGLWAAQAERKATIVTLKGDTIVGILRSATALALNIEVAGQIFTIPVQEVKYLSFVGELPGASVAPSLSPLERALTSLQALRTATEVPILRPQYGEKLQAALPDVLRFTRQADGQWTDVKLAMTRAVASYTAAISSTSAWTRASDFLTSAALWGRYAERLGAQPGEASHVEADRAQSVPPAGQVFGRLGTGDARIPGAIDPAWAGAFADRYELDLPAGQTLDATMTCDPCAPQLALTDASGRRIDLAPTLRGQAHLQRTGLAPGRYTLWASTVSGDVGQYKLTVRWTPAPQPARP